MARKSRVVYLYIKKKLGFLERGVLCSDGNVGNFCSFKGYGAGGGGGIGRKFKNSSKIIFRIFGQTKCIFVTN